MKLLRCPVWFVVIGCVLQLQAKEPPAVPVFLQIDSYDFKRILPPPPAAGSAAEKQDIQEIASVQAASGQSDVARATADQKDSVFLFAKVLGPNFTPEKLPLTAALFEQITADTKTAIKAAKKAFLRPRPAVIKEEESGNYANAASLHYSYPSGHSSRAFVWATLLSKLYPDRQDALVKQAWQMADDRVVLGKHCSDDVRAGQIHGVFLAGEFLKNAGFKIRWQEVIRENAPAGGK